MARILRGVKGPCAPFTGGGWVFFLSSSRGPSVGLSVHLWPCCLWACGGIFSRSRGAFLKGCNFWPFLAVFGRFKGLSRAWRWFGRLSCFWGSVGPVLVVILFACVRCPPAKGKKRPKYKKSSFRPSFLCGLITDKKKRPLLGRFLCGSCCGVWFLPVSGCINRNGTRQAVRGFCQISVFLWRWCRFLSFGRLGLQYNTNYCGLWPPCVSCTNIR